MDGSQKKQKTPTGQKVVSILRAKRLPYAERPAIEPPCVVKALKADIPERDRFLISEADINADIRLGDLDLTALRKCRYILENASGAFSDPNLLELMLIRTIRIISDYGEPEGVPLLREALALYVDIPAVRAGVSKALSEIGDESSLNLLLRLLAVDVRSPDVHLGSISQFLERFPMLAQDAIDGMRGLEADCPAVSGAIENIRRDGPGKP